MTFKLTWTDTSVEIHVEGDFPNQMVAINKALTGDPRHKTIRTMLYDVLKVDNFYADANLIATIADLDVAAYEGAPFMRIAVVTDNQSMLDIVLTYAKRYESRNPKGAKFKLFPDRASAQAWLDTGD